MARAFRPDIQGPRAVAVALVVAYHLAPGALPGGFVGVDVFFVISGFLITGHLVREADAAGRVDLLAFWARRIRRLLPSAAIVLIACLGLTIAVVPRSLWERTVTQIAASALDVQNWALASESVDYLAADATPTLVQHFWSLSVEEQFYLAWPVLVLIACVVGSRRTLGRRLVIAFAVVALASLALSVALTATDPAVAYVHTGTRAWEFASGGLLALAGGAAGARMPLAAGGARARPPRALGALGLLAIGAASVLYSGDTPFPGFAAALPVAGAVLLIATGGGPAPLRALLGSRPFRLVGDASYALYLWHWPLIVVAPYVTRRPLSVIDGIAVVALAAALAAATTWGLETVVRRSRPRPRATYGVAAVVAGALVVASVVTVVVVQASTVQTARAVAVAETNDPCFASRAMVDASCTDPFADPAGLDAAFWAQDKGTLGTCNSAAESAEVCAFGDTADPSRTIALVGNSHAGHLVAALDAYGRSHGWRVLLMRKTGCSGILTAAVIATQRAGCVAWSRSVRGVIDDPYEGVDVVVLASNDEGTHYVSTAPLGARDRATVVAGYAADIRALEAAGHPVLVVGDVPISAVAVPECLDEHRGETDPCSQPDRGADDDLVAEAGAAAGAPAFPLRPYFCSDGRCHVIIGGVPTYIDEHHLTATYSRSLADRLGDAVAAVLEPDAAGG
ncbi:acyltransferase family protein [Galbitalea sp. SE-J8]|uniref:acyltransferase family protein n=1 Tax=Galbitalea sp. SE-J8 TaxID=3054952 RepID=UPI00259CA4FC|nr:acyltransferase family protein [Galbitalea sp. SE-J8]MDM4761943.1 acyltransferase family protein [Galbitalea sp. SE-J8]